MKPIGIHSDLSSSAYTKLVLDCSNITSFGRVTTSGDVTSTRAKHVRLSSQRDHAIPIKIMHRLRRLLDDLQQVTLDMRTIPRSVIHLAMLYI